MDVPNLTYAEKMGALEELGVDDTTTARLSRRYINRNNPANNVNNLNFETFLKANKQLPVMTEGETFEEYIQRLQNEEDFSLEDINFNDIRPQDVNRFMRQFINKANQGLERNPENADQILEHIINLRERQTKARILFLSRGRIGDETNNNRLSNLAKLIANELIVIVGNNGIFYNRLPLPDGVEIHQFQVQRLDRLTVRVQFIELEEMLEEEANEGARLVRGARLIQAWQGFWARDQRMRQANRERRTEKRTLNETRKTEREGLNQERQKRHTRYLEWRETRAKARRAKEADAQQEAIAQNRQYG